MSNYWISCQVMADMKKVYDDLMIINLYTIFLLNKYTMGWNNFKNAYWGRNHTSMLKASKKYLCKNAVIWRKERSFKNYVTPLGNNNHIRNCSYTRWFRYLFHLTSGWQNPYVQMISIFAKTIPTRARRNQLQGFARQSFLHWAGFEVFTNVLVSKTIVRSISGIVNTLVLFVLSFMNSSSHNCHFYPTNGNFFIKCKRF